MNHFLKTMSAIWMVGLSAFAFGAASSSNTVPNITNISNSSAIWNVGLSASVGSSALTVSLKQADGSTDCTAKNPCSISYRSSTLTSGAWVVRQVTGALSVTASSGSTLGCSSALACYVYVYALDNAGTSELILSGNGSLFDQGRVYTTTAEGGSGAADDGNTLYSTTARTGVAIRLLGRFLSTQATAGTWASAMTERANVPFEYQNVKSEVVYRGHGATSAGYGSSNTSVRRFTTVERNVGSALTVTQSSTLGDSITVNKRGTYAVAGMWCGASNTVAIALNATTLSFTSEIISAADTGGFEPMARTLKLEAGDVIRMVTSGASVNTANSPAAGYLSVTEL